MKTGRSLTELAQEVERQAQEKVDFIAPTTSIEIMTSEVDDQLKNQLAIQTPTKEVLLGMVKNTHEQIAAYTKIPMSYYRKMQEQAPVLLADNINHWFLAEPKRRMVRTLDGNARAFLSDRYRVLDNYHLLDAAMNTIVDMNLGDSVVSAEITEAKLYLKVINHRLELEVSPGDVVQAGFCISNSEVGLGSVRVEPLIYRLICKNGMIAQDYSQKKHHIGRVAAAEESYELFADDTLRADDKAFFLKLRDTIQAAGNLAKFSLIVDRMKEAKKQLIEGNPSRAVDVTAKTFHITEEEKSNVLTHLIRGGDLSAYGMLNAVTRTAQDIPSYDRATELEAVGGRILSLSQSSWREIALAK